MKQLCAINTIIPPLLRLVAIATALSLCGCSQDTSKTALKRGSSRWVRVNDETISAAQPEQTPTINPETFLATGRLIESQGNLVQAAKTYEQACQARPDYVAAWNRLGIIYDKLGRYDQAEEAFTQAIQRSPKAAFLQNNLGFSCLLAGKYSKAEKHLRQALQLNGHFQRARVNLGLALAKQEQFDAALGEFKKVLPEAQAYYNLGYLHRQAGRWAQAGDCYKRALEIDPNLAAAKVNLAVSQQSRTANTTEHFETGQSPSPVEGLETDRNPNSSENVESGQTASPAENLTSSRTSNIVEDFETVETPDSFEALEPDQTGGPGEHLKSAQTDIPAEEVDSGHTGDPIQDIAAVETDNSVEDLETSETGGLVADTEAGETARLVLIVEDLKTDESPVSIGSPKSGETGGLGEDIMAAQTVSAIEDFETEQAPGAAKHLAGGESTSHDEDLSTGQTQTISDVETLAKARTSGVTEDLAAIDTIKSIDDYETDQTVTPEEDCTAALTISPLEELATDNTTLPVEELATEQASHSIGDLETAETTSRAENIKTADATEAIGDPKSGETGGQGEDFVSAQTVSSIEELETEQTADSVEALVTSQPVSPDESQAFETDQTSGTGADLAAVQIRDSVAEPAIDQPWSHNENLEGGQIIRSVEELASVHPISPIENPKTAQSINLVEEPVIAQPASPDEDLATAQTINSIKDLRTVETTGSIEDFEPDQTSGSDDGPETAQADVPVEDPDETGQITSSGEDRNTIQIASSEDVKHNQAVERTIAIYEHLLARKAGPEQTIRQTLDGEIQWRLALAEVLLKERAKQSRFAVEELGLAGAWAADLRSTISRAEPILEQTAERLDQLLGLMTENGQSEQDRAAAGPHLRVSTAKATVDHYRGWTHFYRALITVEQDTRKELLQQAIGLLRQYYLDETAESGFAQLGTAKEHVPLRNEAVLLMIKALRHAGQFSESDKLLTWLEQQSLDEQMAYEAGLQRCHLLRDQGHHDTALAGLGQLRSWSREQPSFKQLPVLLTLAYSECTIQAAKAEEAAARGDLASAGEFSHKRLEPLTDVLTAEASEYVRSIVYEQVRRTRLAGRDSESDPERAPLEMLAAGVSLAREGNSSEALKLFDELLSRTDSVSRKLQSEVLWQRGQAAEKAEGPRTSKHLSQLADASPNFPRSRRAAVSAVQIQDPQTKQTAGPGEDLETSE